MTLTFKELDLLTYVLNGYSAKIMAEALRGERDWDGMKELRDEIGNLQMKLEDEIRKILE